ncbi:hypothetical protein U0035_11475 [Niabella yanshanensis]|uniref:Uncharacterized protein n=1 Tax=Niabella yanshanensis TaxID=577386 RepID=A0ABZ0W0U5_9BACT|nr:hypothetical protein [Niabella yanshanensis]WQD36283.1 hypothetical protein U0035_11475 [Niabella yanshanensis]
MVLRGLVRSSWLLLTLADYTYWLTMSNAKIPAIIRNTNNYFQQNAGLFLLMEKAEGVNAGKGEVSAFNKAA